MSRDLAKQLAFKNTQSFGQFFDNHNRRIARAALQVTDIGPVDIGLEREFLLRKAAFGPQPA